MSREKNLEARLREFVKNEGGLAVKLPALHFAGLPDRLILLPGGRAYFAEIKTSGFKPSAIQRAVHEKIRSLGFQVFIIDSNETLDLFKNEIQRR